MLFPANGIKFLSEIDVGEEGRCPMGMKLGIKTISRTENKIFK